MGYEFQLKLIKGAVTAIIIGVIFYCIILHEISHAVVARWLGDDTASRRGRLSLNPLKHIDWFGTVILPLLLYFSAGFIWGYAKPVPINPYNFRNYKRDMGLSALAGPVTNILIGLFFAVLFHLATGFSLIQQVCYFIVFFNFLLAFFNLIPIPPLDGSKVLGMALTDEAYMRWTAQERTGMIALFAIIMVSNLLGLNIFGKLVMPPVQGLMALLGMGT
ncbi:MAG: site-2 protease family protein [Candidatus Cloacimonetes bacterium]|nr:site-2 protease family protein [Candidatus Cloacimonadota bacterium]HNZ06383.1 site-2 protease family protein [Candidatus Cloacimonadota bacterium]HOH78490.1 site-2 protease family protein [Candidatus Cloacimonadota bacterium]